MPNRLFGNLARKSETQPARGRAIAATRQEAALELAQELLRGLEHFVLTTPDLDTPDFMHRLRGTAAGLSPRLGPDELELHRRWASETLSGFGQLQRRYLTEREDEMWRLLVLYQDHQKVEGVVNKQFHEAIMAVHDRLGSVARLDDLRQVRERLEAELNRAATLVEQKALADSERSVALEGQIRDLEDALMSARQDASRDPLTGVFHRGGFRTHLEAALGSPAACALAMIDVDDFKQINDSLGHLAGDEILKQAVQFLGRASRPGDVLCRFGGDEFCLLAPGTPAVRLSDRLEAVAGHRAVNLHLEERLLSVGLSFSIGVAAARPGETAEALIRRADTAMYAAKREGKARVALGG